MCQSSFHYRNQFDSNEGLRVVCRYGVICNGGMRTQHEAQDELSVDVVVVGGGPAGYGAALACARQGYPTLLVERHGFLGGMGAAAGLSSFINYLNGREDLSDSIYRELVGTLRERRASYFTDDANVDFFEPESLKCVMERTLLEAGGEILFHCVFDTLRLCSGGYRLRFLGKGGEVIVHCRRIIDTTGDADVCARAGAQMSYGRRGDQKAQPMTMVVRIGGFDPKEWERAGNALHDGKYACCGCGQKQEIQQARCAGDWTIQREDIAMWWAMPLDPTQITVNGTRILGYSGCDPRQLSLAEIEGRRQAEVLVAFFRKYVSGFRKCYLVSTGPQIGVRETRRIVGLKTLTEDDVIGSSRPADSIAFCSYPIDIHMPDGQGTRFTREDARIHYGIPYGCLVPAGVPNILAAGRCISATHEAAGSFRVMSTCMSLGQAAGMATALSLQRGVDLEELDGAEIRRTMITPERLECTVVP